MPQSVPLQHFYGKIITGAVATRGTASYGLLLPAANFHRIWFGVESDMLTHLLGGKKLKESITLNGKILFVHGRISCLIPKEMTQLAVPLVATAPVLILYRN
jgi:hypothetical protein